MKVYRKIIAIPSKVFDWPADLTFGKTNLEPRLKYLLPAKSSNNHTSNPQSCHYPELVVNNQNLLFDGYWVIVNIFIRYVCITLEVSI